MEGPQATSDGRTAEENGRTTEDDKRKEVFDEFLEQYKTKHNLNTEDNNFIKEHIKEEILGQEYMQYKNPPQSKLTEHDSSEDLLLACASY